MKGHDFFYWFSSAWPSNSHLVPLRRNPGDSGTKKWRELFGGDFERGGDEPEAEPQSEPKDDKPKDYAGSIEDDDEAGQLANNLAQGFDADSAHQELTDMGHGDLADAIKFADSDEEKARIIAKATGNEFYEETININGKQYKPIRESKKHILKENYERFFGEK